MKKIYNWFLYKDGHLDWLKHDIIGTAIFVVSLFFMIIIQDDLFLSLVVAFFITFFAGMGREIYNQYGEGKETDMMDVVWTIKTPVVIIITIVISLWGTF